MNVAPTSWTRRSALAAAVGVLAAACGERATDSTPTGQDGAMPASAGGPEYLEFAYGAALTQVGDLWLPRRAQPEAGWPVVVLIHGGFWRAAYDRTLMGPLAADLAAAGMAAWNIEYRRVGGGGGYPATFRDVRAAIDWLATGPAGADPTFRLDLDRVAVVGHSAGGHLAAWAVSDLAAAAGVVESLQPAVRPVLAVSQAGVLDLAGAHESGTGGPAVADLLGVDPGADPARVAAASPIEMLPAFAPVLALHGTADTIVPPAQSEAYVTAAQLAGSPAALALVDGADHFDVIDPGHVAWTRAVTEIREALEVA